MSNSMACTNEVVTYWVVPIFASRPSNERFFFSVNGTCRNLSVSFHFTLGNCISYHLLESLSIVEIECLRNSNAKSYILLDTSITLQR